MKKLNKAIEKINKSDLSDFEKENAISHIKEWYNEKKSMAFIEERLEKIWGKILPILNEAGLI